ncbi:hypothetical protein AJ88_29060 [Mesorhizobium amorphae CCBAU 01583]|nr:hypothetical protein AJ88_29060 [Mesorhizobium amorphae CCBAU 01583]
MGKLVEGLTKLKKLDLVSKKAEQAENLRKLLLAISEDVRVLLVKLADRLHNMRTLDHVPEAKRLRIAEETMDIYAPLAGRMGMQGMREELEEIAFRYINPEAYRAVTARLAEIFERNKGVLSEIEKSLSTLFEKHAIKAGVKSRQKKPWSVFRKMEAKALSFEQLSDIFGFRSSSIRSRTATVRSAPSTPPGRWCPAASRTTFRRRSRTTTARSTPPSSALRASASNFRSAPAR